MNILCVDDNRMLLRFLVTYLQSKGHNALWQADPRQVMACIDHYPYDAVIMDIRMPYIDGITLTCMIREKHADLPVIMFTGLGDDEEAIRASEKAGANGYISKGLGPADILEAVLRAISQKEALKQQSPSATPAT